MNAEAIRREWAGRVIDGRFTLLEWLGGTERSGVFLTELPGSPAQKAAIKLIKADAGETEARLSEWAAVGSLSHPHLMRLLYAGSCEVDGEQLLYAVSEYADELLSQILPERALTPDETREMLGPVIDTLTWLHGKGLVHGHLKPSNLLVVDDQLKLSADSLCRVGEKARHSASEDIYSAPETAAGTMTAAADVWSLGVTLVEAMTQRLPVWRGPAETEAAAPTFLPQPFAGIARGCLQTDPLRRCTLNDVRAWLDPAAVQQEAVRKPETKAPGKFPVGVMIAVAVVVIAAAAWMYVRSHGSETSLPVDSQQQASGEAKPAAGRHGAAPAPAEAPAEAADQGQEPTAAAAPAAAGVQESDSSKGPVAMGAVSKRVLPELLPAAQGSIQGKVDVRIRVAVDAAGNVSSAVFESQGPSRYFAKAAQDAALQWKFKPAQADGQAVGSTWILAFEFTRAGTEVTPLAAR